MCSGRLDIAAIEKAHGIDFPRYFAAALEQLAVLARDGLVSVDRQHLRATPRGRLLLRLIAMCFDAYLAAPRALAAQTAPPPSYSKVI
jgi:oxygen-independent coproporphyrinogen-3 oxidase